MEKISGLRGRTANQDTAVLVAYVHRVAPQQCPIILSAANIGRKSELRKKFMKNLRKVYVKRNRRASRRVGTLQKISHYYKLNSW